MKKRWKLGQTDRYEQMIIMSFFFFFFIFIPHADKHLIDICIFTAWKQRNEMDSCASYWNLWLLQNTKQLLQILFKSLLELNYCPVRNPNKLYDSTVLNIKYYCSSSFLSTWTLTCSCCLSKLHRAAWGPRVFTAASCWLVFDSYTLGRDYIFHWERTTFFLQPWFTNTVSGLHDLIGANLLNSMWIRLILSRLLDPFKCLIRVCLFVPYSKVWTFFWARNRCQ